MTEDDGSQPHVSAGGSDLRPGETPGEAEDSSSTIRVLAGFLEPQSVAAAIPGFEGWPAALQERTRAMFGRGKTLEPVAGGHRPDFRHVDEPEVLALLRPVAAAQQPEYSNLIGFEWVDIDGILAGSLVTEPTVRAVEDMRSWSPVQIAQYCMLSSPFSGRTVANTDTQVRLAVRGETRPRIADVVATEDGKLQVTYQLLRPIAPIHVLHVRGRVVAIAGLGRLAALAAAGVSAALCMVSYGYGRSVLKQLRDLPSGAMDSLDESRPPLVTDLLDDSLTVEVESPLPTTIVSFVADAFALPDG